MTPFEIAGTLVACLESAYDTASDAGKPARICQRPGDQVPFLFGPGVDECCTGLGWVRVQEIAPTADPDQADQPDFGPCDVTGRRITLEIGVVRCNPSGTDVSCEDWTALAARMDLDALRMRQAVCCLAGAVVTDSGYVYRVLGGAWTPLESQGGCAGGSMTVTVWLDCNDC